MKQTAIYFLSVLFLIACGESQNQENDKQSSEEQTTKKVTEYHHFGAEIDPDGAESLEYLMRQMEENDEVTGVKVSGKIKEVCQTKGCWFTYPLENADQETMRVRFKDYEFFIPRDSDGKNAVVEGKAYRDTTSVERLRHYAEDAGRSEEYIESITEPKVEVVFEAAGVVLESAE